jgi:hypothetical protein
MAPLRPPSRLLLPLPQVEVPRPSPRLTADALQKHIEKFLAACQQQ